MPILGTVASFGLGPDAPTIGTATGVDATSATVTYTASSYIGKSSVTYTATSSPGGLTGTGSSPITVSGLTTGTAYTFTVKATTSYGAISSSSAASNSVTPAPNGAWEQIATVSPTGTTLTTFSAIPEGYSALKIIGLANTVGDSILWTRINEVGANYAEYGYYGGASSTISTAGNSASSSLIRRIASNASASTSNAPFYVTYFNANSTTVHKQVQITSGANTASNLDFTISQGSLNALASKITSITLGTGNGPGSGNTNFAASSRFTLYGLKVGA